MIARPFSQRLHDAHTYIQKRFLPARCLPPLQDNRLPCVDLFMKEMFNVWDAHELMLKVIPKLEHENDGLIFTVDACPYYPGTCEHIFKWKPIHLNSIDFNISKTSEKNVYQLSAVCNTPFSKMIIQDELLSKEYLDKGGVVECVFDRKKSDH